MFTESDIQRLTGDGDALLLLTLLKLKHGARKQPFAIVAEAMSRDSVIPKWGTKKYRSATKRLVSAGYIECVRTGGKKMNDPHQYRFCTSPVSVPQGNTI